MPDSPSPFEELLVLAKKARKHYFHPEKEEQLSTLIKLIFVASVIACLMALVSGLPAHIGQNVDQEENMHSYFGLQEEMYVIMAFFGIQVTVCTLIMGAALPLGGIPIPFRWSYSMRVKHLMLWMMTIWSGALVLLALFWRLWWPSDMML